MWLEHDIGCGFLGSGIPQKKSALSDEGRLESWVGEASLIARNAERGL